MIRITSDLDFKDPFKVSQVLTKALIKVENIKLIEITPSNSKGYHLVVWTTKKYKKKEIFSIRELLDDDKTRIRLDKKRTFGRDTLFYKKQNIKIKRRLKNVK